MISNIIANFFKKDDMSVDQMLTLVHHTVCDDDGDTDFLVDDVIDAIMDFPTREKIFFLYKWLAPWKFQECIGENMSFFTDTDYGHTVRFLHRSSKRFL